MLPVVLGDPDDGTLSRQLDLLCSVLRWIGTCGAVLGVFDMVQKRAAAEEPVTAVVKNSVDLILRSPLVWGAAACWAFYTAILQRWVDSDLLLRYLAGHPVEYITSGLFFIGLAALAMRFLNLTGQFASANLVSLPPIPFGGQPVSACDELLKDLNQLPANRHDGYLVRRLRDALEFVRRKGSADSIDHHLRHLEDQDALRMHNSFSLVRIVVWAMPILGFLGTVIGITIALANLSPQALEQSMTEVTAGLGVAFDTTAQALALTMVAMFAKYGVERMEDRLLSMVDARVAAELVGRFQFTGGEEDANVASIRRMSEQVLESVEALASRQAHVWKSSIDESHQQWLSASASTSTMIKESLSTALSESLLKHAATLNQGIQRHADALSANVEQHANTLSHSSDSSVNRLRQGLEKLAELLVEALHQHGEVLTLSEKELAEENRRHLSEVEAALGEAMVVSADRQEQLIKQSESLLRDVQASLGQAADATLRQQEQLVKQGDVLLKVVDSTGQVRKLEQALNENLSALSRSQHFEELALNLTAAIQMLCARAGTLPGKSLPTGQTSPSKPASHAA
jgi:biopolymer transport protein ExbB/TolQ